MESGVSQKSHDGTCETGKKRRLNSNATVQTGVGGGGERSPESKVQRPVTSRILHLRPNLPLPASGVGVGVGGGVATVSINRCDFHPANPTNATSLETKRLQKKGYLILADDNMFYRAKGKKLRVGVAVQIDCQLHGPPQRFEALYAVTDRKEWRTRNFGLFSKRSFAESRLNELRACGEKGLEVIRTFDPFSNHALVTCPL